MNVVFVVNPVHRWERLGVLSLAAVLKGRGHAVSLLNLAVRSADSAVAAAREARPDVLAYSAMTTEIETFLAFNRRLERALAVRPKSVFGGPHPTFFPELIDAPGVDALCRGEGEAAFPRYLDYLEQGLSPERVQNFWIRDGGRVIRNPLAPRFTDLDALPVPDRALWDAIDPDPVQKSFFASRGCPYRCSYCFNHRYNELYAGSRPVVVRRGVSSFVAEIEAVLAAYPRAFPFFDDDSFLLAPLDWLAEFRDRYRAVVGAPFGCNVRADQVTAEKVALLKEAGCQHCWFGLECGDQAYADEVLERRLPIERIRVTARLLREHGIRFLTQNLTGLPVADPIALDVKTLRLNLECRPDFAVAHMFHPFPGTRLAAHAADLGLFDGRPERLADPWCRTTPLAFPARVKRRLERQHRLFSLVVAFPVLLGLLPLLRRLPLGGLYSALRALHYNLSFRLKFIPARRGLLGFFRRWRTWMKAHGWSAPLLGVWLAACAPPAVAPADSIVFPKIDRRPAADVWQRGRLESLPVFDPESGDPWQLDLRSRDLSALDLSDRLGDLAQASFDARTVWPAADRLPAGFDRDRILEFGKNPGLGVRGLHARGITGQGVGVAIIDQTLLVDHREYCDRLRLYEETGDIVRGRRAPQMHGAAVASLAVGETVGVAKAADLYYIACARGADGGDFAVLARSIRRVLAVNRQLPDERKIRIIAMAIGWNEDVSGFEDVTAACAAARAAGMLVVCSSIEEVHGFKFHGLGRPPLADPDAFESYQPGSWWAAGFRRGKRFGDRLLVPMDSRTTADPCAADAYVFYRQGGWSWSIPYIAGLYALAAQVDPRVTPERFWAAAMATGRTITLALGNEEIPFGPIVDPPALLAAVAAGR